MTVISLTSLMKQCKFSQTPYFPYNLMPDPIFSLLKKPNLDKNKLIKKLDLPQYCKSNRSSLHLQNNNYKDDTSLRFCWGGFSRSDNALKSLQEYI